jgi:hypothetical protein
MFKARLLLELIMTVICEQRIEELGIVLLHTRYTIFGFYLLAQHADVPGLILPVAEVQHFLDNIGISIAKQ